MAGDAIDDVMMTEGDDPVMRTAMFTDPDGDMLTYSVDTSDDTVATATNDGAEITITAVGAGSATITVTATDADGSGMSGTQTFTVTVAPFVLMAPMNVREVFNRSGTIVVGWEAVDGADGYVVIAVNTDINKIASDTVSESVNDGDDTSHSLSGLTPGQTYHVVVASFNSEGAELSDLIMVTAK